MDPAIKDVLVLPFGIPQGGLVQNVFKKSKLNGLAGGYVIDTWPHTLCTKTTIKMAQETASPTVPQTLLVFEMCILLSFQFQWLSGSVEIVKIYIFKANDGAMYSHFHLNFNYWSFPQAKIKSNQYEPIQINAN